MPGKAERAAAAVENEVVVPAELIDVDDRHAVLGGHAREHLFAFRVLADRKRRRGKVDDRFGANSNELLDRIVVVPTPLPEVAIVPHVFTDADAEPSSGNFQRLRAVERLEVPILVEDVVGREKRLSKTMFDGTVAEKRRGIEQRSSLF